MKTKFIIAWTALLIPNGLLAQGQILEKATDGITAAVLTSWNDAYTSVKASGLYSFNARLDVALSYGILTYGGENKGRTTSASLSYYVVRGEVSRLFFALHAGYVTESITFEYSETVTGSGYSYGAFIGSLAKTSRAFAVLPAIGFIGQTVTVKGLKNSSVVPQAHLSVFVPTGRHNALTVEFAYAFDDGVSIFGAGVSYLFSLSDPTD